MKASLHSIKLKH